MTANDRTPLPHPTGTRFENGKARPRLPRWPVPVVAVVVSAATVVVLMVLWRWIDGLALADVEKRATAQLDALKLAASIVVGGGGLFALYLAARRQRTQELELEVRHAELTQRDRVQAHAEQHAEAQHITELYTKASEQLGSEKAPVRLAGLYALERLAQDNSNQRQTVVNVLCAYLRMPFTLPGDSLDDKGDKKSRDRHFDRVQEREVRLAAQRILIIHLNPGIVLEHPVGTFWPDIDIDLTAATLGDFDLVDCRLRNARFNKVTFIENAAFDKVMFAGYVDFGEAKFNGDARFVKAIFAKGAGFDRVMFARGVRFDNVAFGGISEFRKATFTEGVRFNNATFDGNAGFVDVNFAKDVKFDKAKFAGIAGFDKINVGGIAWFTNVNFVKDARFGKAKFSTHAWFNRTTVGGLAWFSGATFGGTVDLGAATFIKGPRFDEAMVANPIPANSSWPNGWQPAAEHGHIVGREGTWHSVARVNLDTIGSNEGGLTNTV